MEFFLAFSRPGTCFVYHCGFLLDDRLEDPKVEIAARAAWAAQEAGRVKLYQLRHGFWDYDYMAVKT